MESTPPPNSPIPYKCFRDATFMIVNAHTGAVQSILEYKGDIVRNPQVKSMVDLFFDTSNESMDFLGELEQTLRHVGQQNTQLILSLKSSNNRKNLEGILKFSATSDNFSEPLMDRLVKLIETYKGMQKELERQYQILDEQASTEKEQSPLTSLRKKLVGTIITTAQIARHMLESIVTGNNASLAHIVSNKHGEQSDLGSTVKNLWMGAKKKEELMELVNSMRKQTYVVEEFGNIRRRVKNLADKITCLSESAGGVLDYWKEIEEGEESYNIVVEKMKEDCDKVGTEMKQLQNDIEDCRELVINARKVVVGKAMHKLSI